MDNIDLNDDNNIRSPDPVKKEKLIDNNNYDYDYDYDYKYTNPNTQNYDDELNKAIELSKNEFELFQEEQEKHILDIIQKEKEERIQKFKTIKQKLNKILLFDRLNSGKYELILSIIEIYEQGYIDEYKSTTKEEFNDFFNLLKTIRLTNEEMDSIKKIIVHKEE
jgi:hypothetical protein